MRARGGQTRVLHVDDDADFASMAASYLERESDALTVTTETRASDALDRLRDGDFECVVSDYQMPETTGLELLREVRDDHPDLPFVLFTGKGSEEIASEAISAGVTDYLQKEAGTDQYAILANRIENAVERYRAEYELERREESLARAQRIADLGNWDWNVETGDLHWSDQIYRIFGVDPADFEETYQAFLGFVHPEDRLKVEAAVDDALSGGGTYDVDHRIVRPDGSIRVVHEQGEVRFEDGDPVFVTGTVYDITERERQAARFQALIEHGSDVVAVVDADGTADFLSPSVRRVLGYDPGDLVGADVLDYVHPDDREVASDALARTVSNPEEVVTAEFRFRTADGDWRVLETVGSNRLDDPAVEGIVVNGRDVTDRKRRERELEQTTEELAVLNRMVRHDIRNDMTVALGWLETVADHVDEEGREALDRARSAGEHVVELTELAGNFVSVLVDDAETELDTVDLERVLTDEVARRSELYPEATFTLDVPPVSVVANEMLPSVFANLLNNAVQHNDTSDPDVSVTVETGDDAVRVRVADDGPGIPDGRKTGLLGRTDSGLDAGGTGIGLYLVESLVSQYGGDVWVEDNEPRGAVFVVELARPDGN